MFLRKHKNMFIAGIVIIAALAASFFLSGGDGGAGHDEQNSESEIRNPVFSRSEEDISGDRHESVGAVATSGDTAVSSNDIQNIISAEQPDYGVDAGEGIAGEGVGAGVSTQDRTEQNTHSDNSIGQPSSGQTSQGQSLPAPEDGRETPLSNSSSGPSDSNSQTQMPNQPKETQAQGKQPENQPGIGALQTDDPERESTVTLIISCAVILNNMDKLPAGKAGLVPPDGIIFSGIVVFYEEESLFNVLRRETRNNSIHLESANSPIYNSAYIEGINNLYEFDCGEGSGWMFSVNGYFPNYSSSRFTVHDGDVILWQYTCDRGADIGGGGVSDAYNFG